MNGGPERYRPAFAAALDLIAQALARVRAAGASLPVLVGGAVVEIDTASAVCTGDFDLLGGDEAAMAAALTAVGFMREVRQGHKLGGWHHPESGIGVAFISGAYFDGRGDRARIRLLAMPSGEVPIASIEDMIADRMGQWEASNRRDGAMLAQASLLLALAEMPDRTYLDRRIGEESIGRAGLATLWEGWDEALHPGSAQC